MARRMTRREFFHALGLGAGTALLAACGGTPAATQQATSSAAPTAVPAGDAGAAATSVPVAEGGAAAGMPIVSSPLTLTYWVETNPNITITSPTFADITSYKELKKISGIDLTFQHPPTGPNQGKEQFNLLIASGKYPDIIETNWLNGYYEGGPAKAVKDGVIIRLNDLIDQHAPNLKKVLTENPEWRKQIVTDEGDIYAFPFLRGDPSLQVFGGLVVRGDLMEKNGLETPTTIDEWYEMLTKLKQDFNGNGQADEYAFSPWYGNAIRGGFNTTHALVGAYGVTTGYFQDNGTVKFGPIEPGFREFLNTMAQWAKAGLVDPDAVSQDQKAYDARMTGNQLGSGMMLLGGGIGKYMGLMKDKDPNFKLVGMPYPTLKKGDKPLLGQRDNVYPGTSAAITSSNQHVEESVKLLDYAYSEAGHMLFNFGVEGLTYTMENGYPKYTDLIMKNPDGLPIAQSMAAHFRSNSGGPFVQDTRYGEQYFVLKEQQDAKALWQEPTNERLLPPITPTQDESRQFARIMSEVNPRYDEVFAQVITGAQPIEAWDSFVAEIKGMGIEDAVAVQQAALDRYGKRT